MRNITPVVKYLIIINVAMLLITMLLQRSGVDLDVYLALYYPGSKFFMPHQFITHMFMHGGFMHLFFNMYALWMFGSMLEQVWGSKRFLFYYMVTGLGAAALHTVVNWVEISHVQDNIMGLLNTFNPDTFSDFVTKYFDGQVVLNDGRTVSLDVLNGFLQKWGSASNSPILVAQAEELIINTFQHNVVNVPTVGASGAVFGVLLAFGMLFPNTQLMLLFPPIPIKAKWFVIIYGLLELGLGLYNPGSNIAHFAHVGGMLFGFFLIKYWQKSSNHFY